MNRRSLIRRLLGLLTGAAVAKVVPEAPRDLDALDFLLAQPYRDNPHVTDEANAEARAVWKPREAYGIATMRLAAGEPVEKGDALYVRPDGCLTRDCTGENSYHAGYAEESSVGPTVRIPIRGAKHHAFDAPRGERWRP